MQIEEPLMKENEVLFMLDDANQQIEEPLPRSGRYGSLARAASAGGEEGNKTRLRRANDSNAPTPPSCSPLRQLQGR